MSGPTHESIAGVFVRFLRFGCLAWGGPAAQIAMIRDEMVDRAGWVTREAFNRALAVYQVLPGPEATELCVYLGMARAGRLGGLAAGLGFVLPGLVLMLALSWAYVAYGLSHAWAAAAFALVQACVAALIVRAVVRIGSHAANGRAPMVIAGAAMAADLAGATFALTLPLSGVALAAWRRGGAWRWLSAGAMAAILALGAHAVRERPMAREVVERIVAPEASAAALGVSGLRAGLLTFGGAYTVIPFLERDAVIEHGWLTPGELLDGVALSGVLPAPLVIVGTFVGYVAGGTWGALAMTLGVFLPAFAFTLVGHRFFERLVSEPRLHALLDGVTAGVVGLIAATAARVTAAGVNDATTGAVFLASLLVLFMSKARWTIPALVVGWGCFGAAREVWLG